MELEESRSELESAGANFEAELNSAHEGTNPESNIDELNEQIKSYESELMAIGSLELQLDEALASTACRSWSLATYASNSNLLNLI